MKQTTNTKTLTELSNEGIKYVVIKRDETDMWRWDIVKKAGKVYGVYLIDLTQPTHLCSIRISFPWEIISNHVKNSKRFTEEELFVIEHPCDNGYFDGYSVFDVVKIYNDERDFEECMENEQCNPTVC